MLHLFRFRRAALVALCFVTACVWGLPALAAEAIVEAPDSHTTMVAALVALGAAIVRFSLVVLRGGAAAKLGKWGVLLVALLSVAAGFLEALAGGGSVLEAVAVALSLLGGALAGNAAAKPVIAARAAKIRGGSIGLDR